MNVAASPKAFRSPGEPSLSSALTVDSPQHLRQPSRNFIRGPAVLATQVRQKDSVYYFVSYPGDDLLDKVQFISRYYGEGEQIAPETPPEGDEIAGFIARIEHSDKAFQRQLSKRPRSASRRFPAPSSSSPASASTSSRSGGSRTSAIFKSRAASS